MAGVVYLLEADFGQDQTLIKRLADLSLIQGYARALLHKTQTHFNRNLRRTYEPLMKLSCSSPLLRMASAHRCLPRGIKVCLHDLVHKLTRINRPTYDRYTHMC